MADNTSTQSPAENLATPGTAYEMLLEKIQEISGLRHAAGLLSWDQETQMPAKGGDARSQAVGVLAAEMHRRSVDDGLWDLLEESENQSGISDDAASILQSLRRDLEKARLLPGKLAEALARTTSKAQQIWAEARSKNSPDQFLPILSEVIRLKREEAACLSKSSGNNFSGDAAYDTLLDQYEIGSTAAVLRPLFANLETGLQAMLDNILSKGFRSEMPWKGRSFPLDQQITFNRTILTAIGFDLEAGRLDVSAHPFTDGLHPTDVRLTTRYVEDDWLNAVSSTLHEGGHGLYEQGLDIRFAGTPLAEAVSLGVHESQSRLWENQVGRSREFWSWAWPQAKLAFGSSLSGIKFEEVMTEITKVGRSFIRVESDEVTYNLHVGLRFELEQALFSNNLQVEGLETAWNEGFKRRFGMTPPMPSQGFLQDVHWSCGLFGYFPTYTLGNLGSAQLYEAACRDLPNLKMDMAAGSLLGLREWLREKVHSQGRRKSPDEIYRAATGSSLKPDAFLRHLQARYLDR